MTRTLKRLGLHLALTAMVLRALLPAGWMPNPSASLTVPLVICTMNGPVRALVTLGEKPLDPGHAPRHDDGRQPSVCPYAAAFQLAVQTPAVTLVPSQATALLAARPSAPRIARHLSRYSLPSPRAPPTAA